ncbi:MAG: MarR family transcriptional regulator [Thermomicrobiales bacterium]|nr:MarR family transcriptional regulator [Thermomicrobiales bacterium]MCO5226720.1 MarR family transcriptional regulator [Thermomicrobiales bacterium]
MVDKRARFQELFGDQISEEQRTQHEIIFEIGQRVEEIERSINRALQTYAQNSGLTLLEAKALGRLLDDGDATLSGIAECEHMPLSTMTGVATRLEKAGLVERTRSEDDRRAYVLSLTPAGMEKLRSMFSPFFEEISVVLEQIGDDTLQSVVNAFDTVAKMAKMFEERSHERT